MPKRKQNSSESGGLIDPEEKKVNVYTDTGMTLLQYPEQVEAIRETRGLCFRDAGDLEKLTKISFGASILPECRPFLHFDYPYQEGLLTSHFLLWPCRDPAPGRGFFVFMLSADQFSSFICQKELID